MSGKKVRQKSFKKAFKDVILFLHRWLGLISGIVVFIVSVTGCLFVFHQEISRWTRSDVLYVESRSAQTLPIEELQQQAARALGIERLPYGLTTYKDPNQTWSALSYSYNPDAWTYFGMANDYRTVYINPYTGEIAGIINEKQDFFQIVKGIHWSLLLATPIGQPIVAWSTLIFVILLISGIILWWPKRWNRAGLDKSFRIKWKATWRRVNYDLHNVLGFYSLILSLIIAVTGLYWAFPFAKKSLYFLGTGQFVLPPSSTEQVVSSPPTDSTVQSPLDVAYSKAWAQYPKAYSISFTAPADSQGTIRATVRPDGETYYQNSFIQFDQYTGQIIHEDLYREKNAGEKLLAMNYDIHIGAIGGLTGKILAFLASLVCASLPVTGFLIWWDREKRKKKRRQRDERSGKRAKTKPETPVEPQPVKEKV